MRNRIAGLSGFVVLAIGFSAAASDKMREPASETPAPVKRAAEKIAKEVRTRISTYVVSQDEANACSSPGRHFTVKLQVKKAVRALDKNGEVTSKFTWETAREVDTDANGNEMELCME